MKFVIFRDESKFKLASADEWSYLEERYKFKDSGPRYMDMDLSMYNALQNSSVAGQIQSYLRELYDAN